MSIVNTTRGLPYDFSHLGRSIFSNCAAQASSHNQANSIDAPAISAGPTQGQGHKFSDTWCKYIKSHEGQATQGQATQGQATQHPR